MTGRFKCAHNSFSYYGEEIGRSIERVAAFGYDAIEIRGGSTDPIASGMVIRSDIIPTGIRPGWTANCEDTVAIGDAALRDEIESRHPELWSRITAPRTFIRDRLGIDVRDEVLQLTPTPAYSPPFWLDPDRALAYA